MSAPGAVIEVRGLRKRYGDVEAVAGIDLTVRESEVFALLGPNGAGKTTTVEILEGYRRRDAGDVTVLGHDPARNDRALKAQLGIVLQSTGVEPYLTAREVLELHRGYYPRPRPVAELLALVGLEQQADTAVRKLSGGQRRRLDLALALAGDPRLVFLDEPTTGFDPSARRQAWEVVRNLTGEGRTVLLTTHFMDEAAHLANRLALIVGGRIVAEGSPQEIAARTSRETTIRLRLPEGAPALPAEFVPATSGERDTGLVELRTSDPTRTLHRVTGWALENRVELSELQVTRPSLEDAYLALTEPDSGAEE